MWLIIKNNTFNVLLPDKIKPNGLTIQNSTLNALLDDPNKVKLKGGHKVRGHMHLFRASQLKTSVLVLKIDTL